MDAKQKRNERIISGMENSNKKSKFVFLEIAQRLFLHSHILCFVFQKTAITK